LTTESTLFIIVAGLYCAQCLFFIFGLTRERFEKRIFFEPTISIVTAARNEEDNIGACLNSLTRLDYPIDKLEIIIVDDRSTDETLSIIRDFAGKHPHVKAIEGKRSSDHLRGKANAIAQGIDASTGEIILMTDADCIVPATWARSTVQHYAEDTGVVAGLTLLRPEGWFAGMQSLDWAYILAVASASMGLKNPLSCIGNNFSFRKKAYDEVGGYRGIPFSVTEDFALFKAITRSGRWGYRYPLEEGSLVFSRACRTVPELYRQKRRWGVGGKAMPVSGLSIMAIAFCMHVYLLTGFFFHPFHSFFISGIILKLACDYILLRIPLQRTRQLGQLKYFWLFELYYLLYVIILPFAVFLGGKVVWKGRTY